MPSPVLDTAKCRPETCPAGVCLARKACPKKALWQEEPFEPPFLRGFLCHSCSKCATVCPRHAIAMV